jgi:hypothetical protein
MLAAPLANADWKFWKKIFTSPRASSVAEIYGL